MLSRCRFHGCRFASIAHSSGWVDLQPCRSTLEPMPRYGVSRIARQPRERPHRHQSNDTHYDERHNEIAMRQGATAQPVADFQRAAAQRHAERKAELANHGGDGSRLTGVLVLNVGDTERIERGEHGRLRKAADYQHQHHPRIGCGGEKQALCQDRQAGNEGADG